MAVDPDEAQRMLNFAHELSALSMQLLCRLLPVLQRNANVSPEAAASIHACLAQMRAETDAFRPTDLERIRGWQKQLSAETD